MIVKWNTCYDELVVVSGVYRIDSTQDAYHLESDCGALLKVFFEGDNSTKAILWAESVEIVKDSMHDNSNLKIEEEI